MGRILIYTLTGDSGCVRAKELLIQKQMRVVGAGAGAGAGVALVEINLTDFPKRAKEMKRLTGKRSVPQIFFNSLHVGVCPPPPPSL
jgi:glutaredoxin